MEKIITILMFFLACSSYSEIPEDAIFEIDTCASDEACCTLYNYGVYCSNIGEQRCNNGVVQFCAKDNMWKCAIDCQKDSGTCEENCFDTDYSCCIYSGS